MGQKTVACLSSYYKGYDFMDELNRLGYQVLLITSENIRDKPWPWHAITETFYMQEIMPSVWNLEHLVQGFAHLLRKHKIDAVVALDDYDVEKAAMIRETFRIPGMGQTTHRYFRDKLAMRQMAKDKGIRVPQFTAVFNDAAVTEFAETVPAPWVLKPRSEASAAGIKKIQDTAELLETIHALGEERHLFLLESFKPGDVYHVDSLTFQGEVLFTSASQYLAPPMQVSHEGGVFRTKTLSQNSEEYTALEKINRAVIEKFGLKNGATHTEFIRGKADGEWYFLETAARVGGAHIPDLIEAASSINIWREWAKIEDALLTDKSYKLPEASAKHAGLLISLIKDEKADRTPFTNDEVYKFLEIPYHIGIVYQSDDKGRIQDHLDNAAAMVTGGMLNVIPPRDKPTA